jgi:ABC-type Fe3+/spermidine/putrescine transport system ATPase subunit
MPALSVRNITKSFGDTPALQGVSFDIDPQKTLAILGPSGCGKSTLLNVIAGLELPDSGKVFWEGQDLSNTPPHLRGFGLMFQDYALFPHRNVFENIAFGLYMRHLSPQEIQERVTEMLSLVNLSGFEKRDVNSLSGGEAQRVALARSLAPQPHFLMLDEPLGALDRSLRDQLTAELRQILNMIHQTALYVTHDQEEAFTLADQVIILNSGRIEQTGSPQEIYRNPKNVFVARFLGLNNLIAGGAHPAENGAMVETGLGKFYLPQNAAGPVTLLIRPEGARQEGYGALHLEGILLDHSFRGSINRIMLEINQIRLSFDIPANFPLPAVGTPLQISVDPEESIQLISET